MAYYTLTEQLAGASPEPDARNLIVVDAKPPHGALHSLGTEATAPTPPDIGDTLQRLLTATSASPMADAAAAGHETPEPDAPEPHGTRPMPLPARNPTDTPHAT